MALLFTAVKAKIGNESAEFLIGGEVESEKEFECSTVYQELRDRADDSELEADMTVYEYGEGERYVASFAELAYLTLRMENTPNFLESRCNKICEKQMSIDLNDGAMTM